MRRAWPSAAVLAGAGLLLLGLLEIIGPCVWDPVELDLAELARARAEGRAQGVQGGGTGPATLVIALAFRMLGTTAWAGRVPMFVFGAVCAAAIYAFAARFFSRRAAAFSVLVLVTTPLYFAHARTMTGEIVPLACIASAFAAFAHAAFGDAPRRRVGSLVLALAFGLVAASSRGVLAGLAVPALAVGLAWAFTRDDGDLEGARFGKAVLAIGAAAALFAVVAIFVANERVAALALGLAAAPSKRPTFDAPIGQIAYAFFPWSAVLPLALMALGRAVPRGARTGPRVALLLGVMLSTAAHAALAPRTGMTPLAGASFFALAAGVTLASLDTADASAAGARAVRFSAVAAMLGVAYLVTDDLTRAPEKILEPFALAQTATLAAGKSIAAQSLPPALGPTVVRGVRIAALLLVPFAVGASLVSRRRGALLLVGGILSGLVLRLHVYPALFARVAPESALDTYGKKHSRGERLGLLGVNRRSLAYVHHAPNEEAVTLVDPPHAADFLASTNGSREWLALGAHDLPQVNALYRARRGHNAPVLAGGGDNVLLAVSELHAGENDESPLAGFVLDGPPKLSRSVHATFADRFEAIAWDLETDDGTPIPPNEAVAPRSSFHFKIALEVKQPTPGGYCTFIHVDHTPTRISIEHKDFSLYPMTLWRQGDVIVDDFAIKLPAHFGHGAYQIHFGIGVLPCEDDRRMPITAGANDGHDRLKVGTMEVR